MAAAASGPGDFFARQDAARGATRRLVVLYLLAVAAVVVASDLALSFIFQLGSRHTETLPPVFHLAIGGGVLLVIAVGALMQWFELRGDAGETVAARLGGRRVAPGSQDQRERRLLNVVEEMALAAGLPVPAVYVLEGEGAINAFAAGWSSDRASVAVTRGALDTLTRDELQGVVAHELSHVLNGDMALNLRLMCGQHGLLALTEVGRLLMRTRGRKNPLPLAGLALWLLGWIGWAGAALLRAAVNRRREHLADAAAVQFTRNPHGLASALRKIGGSATGAGLAHPGAAAASHLLFAGGEGWSAWTSTHPPLAERIRLLDPAWDGRFPAVLPTIATSPPPPLPVAGLAPARPATAPQAALVAALPTPGQVRFATTTIAALPPALAAAARDPAAARAVALALLADPDPARRRLQTDLLGADPLLAADTARLLPLVAATGAEARLPLLELAAPALRSLSTAQRESFLRLASAWVHADGRLTLVELVGLRLLRAWLAGGAPPRPDFYAIAPLVPAAARLLATLAALDGRGQAAAAQAFACGWGALPAPAPALPAAPAPAALDADLDLLRRASPAIRRQLVEAAARTVAADGLVTAGEAELVRAVADTLGCPLPPFADAAGRYRAAPRPQPNATAPTGAGAPP